MEIELRVAYKSRLHEMTQTTPTMLWNDSADIDELTYAIENGAVGATCNPVIAVGILKKEISIWRPRIQALMRELPAATEDQIGWRLVEEMSMRAAKLLEPAFHIDKPVYLVCREDRVVEEPAVRAQGAADQSAREA